MPPPTTETRSAGVTPPSVETRRIQTICDEIIAFRQSHSGRLPNRGSNALAHEQQLGNHRYKLKMRCSKALSQKPSERMLNADERALFERAVSEALPESQTEQPSSSGAMSSTCGATPPTISGAMPGTCGETPPTADASAASSLLPVPLPQGNTTGRGIKRPTRGPAEQNADTAASAGKCRKSQQENLSTAAGQDPCTVKRKSQPASCSTPPTRKPRKAKIADAIVIDNGNLSAENWAELCEMAEWLKSPEALHVRKKQIELDTLLVQGLLVHPPNKSCMESAGARLHISRDNQKLELWHYRCVREALHYFRTWQQGGVANMLLASPVSAYTPAAPSDNVETVADMQHRSDFWWTPLLTRCFRRFVSLRSQYPQLLDSHHWEMLQTRLELAMRSTNHRAIRQLCRQHKDFVLAAGIQMNIQKPMIASPECSEEVASANTSKAKKCVAVPIPVIHYHFCCFVACQVETLRFRSEEVNAVPETKSEQGAVGATPPEAMSPIGCKDTVAIAAGQPDVRTIVAEPPEDQSLASRRLYHKVHYKPHPETCLVPKLFYNKLHYKPQPPASLASGHGKVVIRYMISPSLQQVWPLGIFIIRYVHSE